MKSGLPGRHWQDKDGLHIDVRSLSPPQPMVAILGQLDQPDQQGPVTVHHDREPIYLYPELAERGWTWKLVAGEIGEVRLILSRPS
ncbi:MAG: DUF2249 domain-containing protein [Alphaproteobacteria bacterium]|nr:DUF2249 domain-containing protein [Alphaproteobacteria bacterium]